MATVALVLALGGTGYAAFKVGTNNIKNGAVTTKKIKNGAVTNSKLANGAVTGSKVNLATLGTVPNANHANTANSAGNANTVGGSSVSKIFALVAPGAASQPFYSANGLTLSLSCDPTGHNEISWSNSSSAAELQVNGNRNGTFFESENFHLSPTGNLFPASTFSEGNIQIVYGEGTAHKTDTVNIGFDFPSSFGSINACAVFGSGTSSS